MTVSKEFPDGKRIMNLFLFTGLTVAGLLMVVGLGMRMAQAGWLELNPADFYSLLTLHGAGMITSLVLCGMGGIWYLVRREVKMDVRLAMASYGLILVGVVLVLIATLVGKFATAWTFLYPLPFVNPTWPSWSTGAFLIGLMLITIGWTLWSLQVLEAVLRAYKGLRGALAWDLVFHPKAFKDSGREPPPAQMLPALVISIDGLIMASAGMLIGVALLVHWIDPSVGLDPLWAKNVTYFFGHSIANFIIYMLLALVYVGLPRYTNRKWKTSAVFAVGWWSTMVFLLLAYFHHLYLDFAQPQSLQYLGQIASYLSAIPVTVVTVYGGLMLVWRSGMRWALGSLFMYVGMAGWIVGGAGALLDASVPFNVRLHNTLWVPAHFHNYLLGGSLFFALGWIFQRLEERSGSRTPLATRWLIGVTVFGGTALFLLSFYVAGAQGVPRRFSVAPDPGPVFAAWGSVGAIVLLVGLLVCLLEGVRLWLAGRSVEVPASSGQPLAPGAAPTAAHAELERGQA